MERVKVELFLLDVSKTQQGQRHYIKSKNTEFLLVNNLWNFSLFIE